MDVGSFVVAGCDAPEVLETAEHALDEVAALVGFGIVFMGVLAGWIGRYHGLDAALRQPVSQAVGIVSSVGQQASGRRDCWQQIACGRQVMAIAWCDQERHRAAAILGQRVDFCGASAARAPDCLLEVPPFAPAAERWALMCVESIDIVPTRPVEPVRA